VIEDDHVGEWLLFAERRPLPERAVRAMLVQMPNVCDEHAVKVAAAEDQQSVEAFAANASDPVARISAGAKSERFNSSDGVSTEL
jgi:hypothetical protein